MNISLTPKLEEFVQAKVEAGFYTSASEVIRESLRLLQVHEELQRQRIVELNQAIDIGMKQLHDGASVNGKTSYEKMQRKMEKLTKGK